MKSSQDGKSILVSVENVTPSGKWLFVNKAEYFLSYEEFPFFRDQTLVRIQNVESVHSNHLYWPDLDVDLEVDNLVNPEKYPLKSKIHPGSEVKKQQRAARH